MYHQNKINNLAWKIEEKMFWNGGDYKKAVNELLESREYERKFALNHEKEIMAVIYQKMDLAEIA